MLEKTQYFYCEKVIRMKKEARISLYASIVTLFITIAFLTHTVLTIFGAGRIAFNSFAAENSFLFSIATGIVALTFGVLSLVFRFCEADFQFQDSTDDDMHTKPPLL